jgi:hypothetical protein
MKIRACLERLERERQVRQATSERRLPEIGMFDPDFSGVFDL